MMQPTEHEERIILSLAHLRPGEFQVAENLLVRGLRRMGQGRLELPVWSELRPTDAESVRAFAKLFSRMDDKSQGLLIHMASKMANRA
jgi:hypothetical protein